MPINITDEFHAATTKGKIASAKEVFLTGDTENLQQIGEKTHQLEDYIKNIAITGGASTAAAVTFDNTASGMTAVTAQAAIDELSSKISKEKTRVDGELEKKFAKADIVQEPGNSEELVMSQKTVTDHLTKLENNNPYFFEDKKLGFIIQGVETDINWNYIEVYQYMNRKTTSEYLSQLLSLHAYVNSKTYDFSIGYKNNVVRTSKEIYELTSTTDSGVKIKLYVDWGALQNVAYSLISPAIKINNSLIKVNYKTAIDNVESSLNNKITTLKGGIMYNYKGEVVIV